jgi:hypothetical protein
MQEDIEIFEDKYILGKKGICSDCGKEGIYCYEPFYEEIHEEKYIICLCKDCEHERYQNV